MKPGQVTTEMTARYFRLFVNRLAYTVQSHRPDFKGKHYYYRPRDGRQLTRDTIGEHLNGRITIGIYALNPKTQRSKWVSIDADYENALDDLLKLQWELRCDGVEAAPEKSRRGAPLWIFCEKPLLARHCRIYIYNLARRLKVPVKGGARLAEGVEVFPRRDNAKHGDLTTIEAILSDQAASFWLKAALLSDLSRDPVDAANEAHVLARLAIIGAPMPQYV